MDHWRFLISDKPSASDTCRSRGEGKREGGLEGIESIGGEAIKGRVTHTAGVEGSFAVLFVGEDQEDGILQLLFL